MMMKRFLFFLLLLLPFATKAQLIFNQKNTYDNNLSARWTVLPIIDIHSGSAVVLGIEHKLIKNIALSYDAGTYFTHFNGMDNVKGIILRSEIKCYANENGMANGAYLSLAFAYKHQSFDTRDSFIVNPTNYRKDFSVLKDVSSLTLKVGVQDITRYGLLVDFYGGLGVRYKRTSNTLTEYENNHFKGSDYGVNISEKQAVEQFTLNIELGVRIGFSIIR